MLLKGNKEYLRSGGYRTKQLRKAKVFDLIKEEMNDYGWTTGR